MNKMKLMLSCLIGILSISMTPGYAFAENAEVLPKGKFSFGVEYKHYLPWTERFDKDGNVQDAASDFNGALDSRIFPSLAIFQGAPFNIASPNIGTTVASFKYSYERVEPSLAYGITDSLSFGVKVPYIWYNNDVDAQLDTTNANIGLNPGFNPALPAGPTNLPLIPTALGGTKLSNEQMQQLLGAGLPGIQGFGFKRFESWKEEGFGDVEAGFKYQYYKSDNWRLAGGFGALFPVGKLEDQDNLVDVSLGGGSYALLFRSYNDFTGIKNLIINVSAFYTLVLPQEREMRIFNDPHQPLVGTKKNVTIHPGDLLEIESSATYQFNGIPLLKGTSVELLYHYTKGFENSVPDAPSLEKETGGEEQSLIARIGYSTIPMFIEKKFPIPMTFYLGYRNKFAGSNGSFKTQYLQTGVSVFF